MRWQSLRALVVGIGGCAAAATLTAATTVSLTADTPSPAPVGRTITWSASVSEAPSNIWYRFRAREAGGDFHTIRDYGPLSTLAWTSLEEGGYEVEVSVKEPGGDEIGAAASAFQLQSRVQGDQPVVSPTSNPLVFLYSGPPCGAGTARVQFESAGGLPQLTPSKPCAPGRSENFYLAGLEPASSYSATLVVSDGRDQTSIPAVSFSSGAAPASLLKLVGTGNGTAPSADPILLESPIRTSPIALDSSGNILWYGPADLTYMTRPGGDGTFYGVFQATTPANDIVRRFDLAGMTLQETNVARVNEQLAAMGKRSITDFHHEARPLSGGRLLVLGAVEQMLTGVQGPGAVDVIGDMILVLDSELQVAWTWDAFDHLDVSRKAVLGETCAANGACAVHYLSTDANDWTHGNAVGETSDGALLYSARHQDWLIKIDFRDGAGNGDVLWRLGKDGDFTIESDDPYPWFSHQHDAGYEAATRSTITLFDNGNTRLAADPNGSSRGQELQLDEERRTVRLLLNTSLGVKSLALGSAQKLPDGEFHWNAGVIFDPSSAVNPTALSLEVDPAGSIVDSVRLLTSVYRSFRVADLYGLEEPARRPDARVVPRSEP